MTTIITLLTDFGLTDSYVAEMKATLLHSAPQARLVDISHELEQGDVRSAQYLLARCWHRFPSGSVHLAVVDPGVGTARLAVAAERDGHRFVGPDNGLLTPVLDGARVVELAVPADASPTFHGRDVFAPAAARLACGTALEQLGPPVADPRRTPLPAPRREADGRVIGEVLYIDHYGTLVTNIAGSEIERATGVSVAGGHTAAIGRTFGDVEPGALVAFVGSAGTLELAARNRSAAQLTGASIGAEVRLQTQ